MKIYCLSAAVLSSLFMAIAIFLGNIGSTEFKSQMRKFKQPAEEVRSMETTLTDTEYYGERNVRRS